MNLPNNHEIISLFTSFLVESGLSSVSIKNYLSDIRHFLRFLDIKNHNDLNEVFQNLSKHVNDYVLEQKTLLTPTATTNRRLASIRRLSTFLQIKFQVIDNSKTSTSNQNASPSNLSNQSNEISTLDKNSNIPSKKILDQFKQYLINEKKTHSTVKNYLSDLYHYFSWIANQTPYNTHHLTQVLSNEQLQGYITYQKLTQTSTSVINRRQSSIKKLTHYCFAQGYIPTDPFELVVPSVRIAPLSWLTRLIPKAKNPQNPSKNRLAVIYHKYNSLPFTPYLHLALLVLATTTMAILGYNQIIKQANPSLAATALTPPKRQLSFQGRLSDSAGTPITTAVNVTFKLWDDLTAGTQLYTTGTCSVTPDQDGIFNSLIGDTVCGSEIPQSVFTDHRDVYLAVTVGSETLTPRQQIATVGYALNSETLQGYPASAAATINTVPVVDNSGNINIAAASPAIISTSGNFNIKGQSLSLTTTLNSGGDIVLQPDALGSGQILAIGGTTTEDSFRLTNANLTTGSLFSGYIGNDTATSSGRLLSLSGGATETDRFYVGADGSTKINTATDSSGISAFIIDQNTVGGNLFSASASGTSKFTINSLGGISLLDGVAHTIDDIAGNLTLTSNSSTISLNDNVSFAGTTTLNGQTYTWPASQTNSYVLQTNGAGTLSWVAQTGGGTAYWDQQNGALYPLNSTVDFLLGGQASSSAKFAVLNMNTGTPVASISANSGNNAAYLTGDGTLGTSNRNSLTLGNSSTYNTTGNILLNPNGTGNVGIGTTNPLYKLEVTGTGLYTGNLTTYALLSTAGNLQVNWGAVINEGSNDADTRIESDANTHAFLLDASADAVGIGGYTDLTGTTGKLLVNGNVGIGTTGPTARLDLKGTGDSTGLIFQTSRATTGGNHVVIQDRGNMGIGTTAPDQLLEIAAVAGLPATSGTTQNGAFRISRSDGGINALDFGISGITPYPAWIQATNKTDLSGSFPLALQPNSGNVGIGTTAPTAKLDVAGDASVSGHLVMRGSGTNYIHSLNGSNFGISTSVGGDAGNTERLTILNSGNIGIGTTAPARSLVVYSGADIPHLQLASVTSGVTSTDGFQIRTISNETYLTNFESTKMYLGNGGSQHLTIDASGNVGIGDTTPDAPLDVVGDVYISDGLSLFETAVSDGTIEATQFCTGDGETNCVTDFSTFATGTNYWTRSNGNISPVTINDTISATTSASTTLTLTQTGAFNALLVEDQASDTSPFVIDQSGNVGIGTLVPGGKLDINTSTNQGTVIDNTSTSMASLGLSNVTSGVLFRRSTDGTLVNGMFNYNDSAGIPYLGIRSRGDIQFFSNTTPSLTIMEAGNVGIGTTAPNAPLQIYSDTGTGTGAMYLGTGANASTMVSAQGRAYFGYSAGNYAVVQGAAAKGIQFNVNNNTFGAGTAMIIESTGVVGVGTTGPDRKLDILDASSPQLRLTQADGTVYADFQVDSNGDMIVGVDGTSNQLVLDNGGNIGIGTTAPSAKLEIVKDTTTLTTETTYALRLVDGTDDTGLLLGTSATANIGIIQTMDPFNSWTTRNLALQPNGGSVGIGTTAPAYLLDVSGGSGIVGQFSGRVIGADAVNTNEFMTLGQLSLGTGQFWQRALGSLTPANITNDVNIGAVATASALVHLPGLVNENAWFNLGTGNVGIGTTNPSTELDVSGGAGHGAITIRTTGTTGQTATLNLISGFSGTNGDASIQANNAELRINAGTVGGTNRIISFYPNNTETFRINSLGNVGIGTTSPTAKLDIVGDASISASFVTRSATPTFDVLNGGNLVFQTSPGGDAGLTTAMTLANNGNLTVTGTVSAADFTCTDCLDFTELADTLALDAALVINQSTNTWTQNFTGTTTDGFTYNANSLTSGDAVNIFSTSTALTTGNLLGIDWSPGSATTATGDLFSLNIGANGTIGNLFNIKDTNVSLFSVSETAVTSNLPTSFTSAGDVSIAYDLNFTNPTTSSITSSAPLGITAGESFNSSNLTLKTYNKGNIIADTEAFSTTGAATISGTFRANSTTTFNALTYTWPASQTANYVLQTNGSGTLSWAAQSDSYWRQANGTLFPLNSTVDFLLGGQATSSAKFAVLNMNTGTPVASISANSGNNATFLSGNGNLGTTNMSTLTIGGSSTGNISLDSNIWDITGAGLASGLTGITSSGTINFSGLTASSAVYTDGSKNLTSVAPTSGALGYWQRNQGANGGGSLTPTNVQDSINLGSTATASAQVHLSASTVDYQSFFMNPVSIGFNTAMTNPGYGVGFTMFQVDGDILPLGNSGGYLGRSGTAWKKLYIAEGINDDAGTEKISIVNSRLVGTQWNASNALRVGDTTNSIPSGLELYVTGAGDKGDASVSGTLGVGDLLTVSGNSELKGDVTINGGTGKINVGTVDPPYTINGEKYATYMSGMIGVKEEVAGNLATNEYVEGLGFRKTINFNNQVKGSDLWLFGKTTSIKQNMSRLSVLLSPKGQARAWYEIDEARNTLFIYSSSPTEISYRFTAPRFDDATWTNTRSTGPDGFILNDPDTIQTETIANINYSTQIANIDGIYKLMINNEEKKDISSFSNSIIANLKAGIAVVNELVVDNLTINSRLISPVAQIGELEVLNATISGNLYADNIKGKTIDKLNEQLNILDSKYSTASAILANLQEKYTNYDSLFSLVSESSSSADYDPLALSPLATTSASLPSDLSLNSLNVHTLMANDILANGSIFSQSLNSFDTDLYIQASGERPVHILANLMSLYPDGKVVIEGDLIITGNIFANNIDTRTATISGTLAVGNGYLATNSASILALFNESGDVVGSVDSAGAANFGEVTTNGLIIASGIENSASISGQTASNSTIGTASIATGSSEILITNNKITADTLIYITPVSDTNNQVLYVKSKQVGSGFTVAVPQPVLSETSFNFWLVQTR